MAADLQIDPSLNPDAAADVFARVGRLHLPHFLTPASAEAVADAARRPPAWFRATQYRGETMNIEVEGFEAYPPEQKRLLYENAFADARTGFQFLYDRYPLSLEIEDGKPATPGLRALYDFLNGSEFLRFIRRLTRDDRPGFTDAQVTRYRPGHFLTSHNDENPEANRLYAYVLNLTKGWRADWGGLLMFLDDDGHVSEAYTPAFNALNIFRVPAEHAVSVVAPFAVGDRLSVTGWIRHRPAR